jgi:putative tributyrin esterase
VAPLGLSVVMPNVHRSFYTNMRSGYRYWDFVSQELLEKARGFFPLSSAREDNFVAGLSMGGYGALKLALTLPEQFAAAASLSGVLDVAERRVDRSEDFELIFGAGGPQRGSAHDLFQLATSLASSGRPKPRLYQCCGTEHALPRRGPGTRLRLPLRRRAGRPQLGLLGQDGCPNPHLARARLLENAPSWEIRQELQ